VLDALTCVGDAFICVAYDSSIRIGDAFKYLRRDLFMYRVRDSSAIIVGIAVCCSVLHHGAMKCVAQC